MSICFTLLRSGETRNQFKEFKSPIKRKSKCTNCSSRENDKRRIKFMRDDLEEEKKNINKKKKMDNKRKKQNMITLVIIK